MKAADLPIFLAGASGLIIAGFLITLAIFWLVFPLMVWSKLKVAIRHLASIEQSAEQIARNTRQPGEKPEHSTIKYIAGIND